MNSNIAETVAAEAGRHPIVTCVLKGGGI